MVAGTGSAAGSPRSLPPSWSCTAIAHGSRLLPPPPLHLRRCLKFLGSREMLPRPDASPAEAPEEVLAALSPGALARVVNHLVTVSGQPPPGSFGLQATARRSPAVPLRAEQCALGRSAWLWAAHAAAAALAGWGRGSAPALTWGRRRVPHAGQRHRRRRHQARGPQGGQEVHGGRVQVRVAAGPRLQHTYSACAPAKARRPGLRDGRRVRVGQQCIVLTVASLLWPAAPAAPPSAGGRWWTTTAW
jgi:hypothetical protein